MTTARSISHLTLTPSSFRLLSYIHTRFPAPTLLPSPFRTCQPGISLARAMCLFSFASQLTNPCNRCVPGEERALHYNYQPYRPPPKQNHIVPSGCNHLHARDIKPDRRHCYTPPCHPPPPLQAPPHLSHSPSTSRHHTNATQPHRPACLLSSTCPPPNNPHTRYAARTQQQRRQSSSANPPPSTKAWATINGEQLREATCPHPRLSGRRRTGGNQRRGRRMRGSGGRMVGGLIGWGGRRRVLYILCRRKGKGGRAEGRGQARHGMVWHRLRFGFD